MRSTRAARDSKYHQIQTEICNIKELEGRIEEKKAKIRILVAEEEEAQKEVDDARAEYYEDLVMQEDVANNQMDNRIQEAQTSDYEIDPLPNSSDAEP